MISKEEAISKTAQWIKQVVIDCHFCPFAALPVKKNRVRYVVERSEETAEVLKISTATVKREWTIARAWLYKKINGT